MGGALFTPTKVSLFEKGRPSPTLIKAGVEGAKPHGGGSGGCPPTKPKEGARCPPLQPRHEWGPSHWRTLSLRGRAKGVQGGEAPMAGGLGGVPHKFKRGSELTTIATPPRVGPKTLANPQPAGVGKGGPGGLPPGRGCGGCAPRTKGGEQPTLATRQPGHEWDPKPWQTLSQRGWGKNRALEAPFAILAGSFTAWPPSFLPFWGNRLK